MCYWALIKIHIYSTIWFCLFAQFKIKQILRHIKQMYSVKDVL